MVFNFFLNYFPSPRYKPEHMPRGPHLTIEEIAQIRAFHSCGKSQSWIEKELKRSRKAIARVLKEKEKYKVQKRPGRPCSVTKGDKRRMFSITKQGNPTCNEIKTMLQLPIEKRQIARLLRAMKFTWRKKERTPLMTAQHEQARKKWALDHLGRDKEWKNVIFSDEKRFNLDGPDGNHFYWHFHNDDKQFYSTRQNGGKSIMVWGAISHRMVSELAFIDQRMNAVKYCEVLFEYMLDVNNIGYGGNAVFQQDNASVHTAFYTMDWFKNQEINVMQWPAKSPDLNPIENVWATMAQKVYDYGRRQFDNISDLKAAIETAWKDVTVDYAKQLISSMPARCKKCHMLNGKVTGY